MDERRLPFGLPIVMALGLAIAPLAARAAVLEFKPEAGLTFERVERTTTSTKIVKPNNILTSVLELGSRDVGRVMDTTGGEIRVGVQSMQSALKVNGKVREGGVPGAGEMLLRVYSPNGELVRTASGDRIAGDIRELAVKMPEGEIAPGKRWKQTFHLDTGSDAEPLLINAQFEIVGPKNVLGREAWEIRGALRLDRSWSPKKLLSSAAGGKLSAVLDASTGLPLSASYLLKAEQVREDPISLTYVKAGGQKLGFYVDLRREMRTTYFGTGTPPALEKALASPR